MKTSLKNTLILNTYRKKYFNTITFIMPKKKTPYEIDVNPFM